MNIVIITPSKNKLKKFDATINGTKTISFGARGMSDFTIHKNEARKNLYLNRHRKREDWGDAHSAGFYSRWVLWNKPTLKESIEDMNKRFANYHFVLRS
jgi:hypothetical protein